MNQGIPTGGLNMNTQWKNGYEEGFAAGWKAAQKVSTVTIPPMPLSFSSMNDQPYNVSVSSAYTTDTITITEPKKPKKASLRVIRNLTDHTEIV